jgi:hypothetical protein
VRWQCKRGLEISYEGEEEMTIKAEEDAQQLDSRFKDGGQATPFIAQHLCLQHWFCLFEK